MIVVEFTNRKPYNQPKTIKKKTIKKYFSDARIVTFRTTESTSIVLSITVVGNEYRVFMRISKKARLTRLLRLVKKVIEAKHDNFFKACANLHSALTQLASKPFTITVTITPDGDKHLWFKEGEYDD